MKVEKRINEIVNRLNKTKEEKFPDLRALREERDRAEREDQKHKLQEQKKREKEELERKEKEKEMRFFHIFLQSVLTVQLVKKQETLFSSLLEDTVSNMWPSHLTRKLASCYIITLCNSHISSKTEVHFVTDALYHFSTPA